MMLTAYGRIIYRNIHQSTSIPGETRRKGQRLTRYSMRGHTRLEALRVSVPQSETLLICGVFNLCTLLSEEKPQSVQSTSCS